MVTGVGSLDNWLVLTQVGETQASLILPYRVVRSIERKGVPAETVVTLYNDTQYRVTDTIATIQKQLS